jgi:hypothetical protein
MPVAVAVPQVLSGGRASPTDEYLWLVVVYATSFFPPVPALAYVVACSAVSAAPLLYDAGAVEGNLARELLVVVPLLFIVGALIFAGRRLLGRLSRRATALQREQRRISTSSRRCGAWRPRSQRARRRTSSSRSSRPRSGGCSAPTPPPSAATSASGGFTSWASGRTATDAGTVVEVEPDDELARARRGPADPGRPLRRRRTEPRAPLGLPVVRRRARARGRLPSAACSSPARGGPRASRSAPRSGCAATPTSSRPPSRTPRTARAWTAGPASTRSRGCRTTARSATASRTRSVARAATAGR